ncbi:MAG: hypothetical protein DRG33_01505, partial [Deltaproteobacteria bacterium]
FHEVRCEKCKVALLARTYDGEEEEKEQEGEEEEEEEEKEPTSSAATGLKSDWLGELKDLLFDLNIPYEDQLKIIRAVQKIAALLLFYDPKEIADEYKKVYYTTDNRTEEIFSG